MANRRNRSGRKRKTPKDWAKDHPDDLESRGKPTGDEMENQWKYLPVNTVLYYMKVRYV